MEGPLYDSWPPESHRRLFGDLPLVPVTPPKGKGKSLTTYRVESKDPEADGDRLLRRSLDMRYQGQSYELTVPVSPSPPACSLPHPWEEAFHAEHAAIYGHSSPGQPTEIEIWQWSLITREPKGLWSKSPIRGMPMYQTRRLLGKPVLPRGKRLPTPHCG